MTTEPVEPVAPAEQEAVAPEVEPVPALPGRVTLRAFKWLLLSYVIGIGVTVPLAVVNASEEAFTAVFAAGFYGTHLWAALRIAQSLGGLSLRDAYGFFLQRADVWRGPIVYLVMVAASIAVAVSLDDRLVGSNTEDLGDERSLIANIVAAFTIAVVAPVFEELFFRGVLLRALNSSIGPKLGNVVQAAVFGFVHLTPDQGVGNIGLVLILTVSGLVFGWSANKYRSLGPSIIAHGMGNAIAFSLNVFA